VNDLSVQTIISFTITQEVVMIQLIVTRKCNFLCAHCMWACDANGTHMPSHIFDRALEFVAKAAAVDIIGGEPTLQPEFRRIVDRCSDLVISMRIATNGFWASPRLHADVYQTVFEAILAASGKLGSQNVFIRLSDDRWHRKFTQGATIDRAFMIMSSLANVYIPPKYGLMYPLGRAREGRAFAFLRSRGYDRAPAECTKGEYSFWRSASIDVDGSVSPCTHHQAICGNIMSDSMDTIIENAQKFIASRRIATPSNMECVACKEVA
jgi:radical SAM protein with 4Fe4S-binding SPASM domain